MWLVGAYFQTAKILEKISSMILVVIWKFCLNLRIISKSIRRFMNRIVKSLLRCRVVRIVVFNKRVLQETSLELFNYKI